MWSAIASIATWLLGKLFAPKEPTVASKAAEAATATAELHEEQAANAVTNQAAAARADADVAVVRAITDAPGQPVVDSAANERLRQQFPDEFR